MLAQEVAAEYNGKVRFVTENFGESKLAERFGVTRYPAVFVDDILVARPRDFGFFGKGDSAGRYTPWVDAASQARFKADLKRMVELDLSGKKAELSRERAEVLSVPDQIAGLPTFRLTDLAGNQLDPEVFKGHPVVVEFWATWCPPCHSTLEWLGQLKKKYGDDLQVIALAVESPEDKVRATASSLDPAIHWAISDAPTARAFGDVTAVPTMLVFDRDGKTAHVFYGAPPDLHDEAEKILDAVVKPRT